MKAIIHSLIFFSALVLFSGNAQAQFEIDQSENSNFALQSKFQTLTCGSLSSHGRTFCPAPAGYRITSVRVVHLSLDCRKRPTLTKWNWNYRGITTNDGCRVRLSAFLKPAR